MNRVRQPRPLVVLGINAWIGTAAGADELVEIPTVRMRLFRTKAHPLLLIDESASLVLWCFVLNPHRRSPYPNSQLELRERWCFGGAMVLCIKPTSSFPVPQFPT
jgi:hypothetical protein